MISRISRAGGIHASIILLVHFLVLFVNGYCPDAIVRLQSWPRPTLLVAPTSLSSGASHTTATTTQKRRIRLRMGGYEFYAGPEYATETIPKKHTIFGISCVEESFVLGPLTSRTSISNLVPIKEEGTSETHALVQYLMENQIEIQGKSILEVGASGISTIAATLFWPSSLTVAHFDPQRLHIWEHGYWFLNKPTACPVETRLLEWPLVSLPYADIVFITALPKKENNKEAEPSWEFTFSAAAAIADLARTNGSRVLFIPPGAGDRQVLDIFPY